MLRKIVCIGDRDDPGIAELIRLLKGMGRDVKHQIPEDIMGTNGSSPEMDGVCIVGIIAPYCNSVGLKTAAEGIFPDIDLWIDWPEKLPAEGLALALSEGRFFRNPGSL